MTARELQYNRIVELVGKAANQQGTVALRQQRAVAAADEILNIFELTLVNFSEHLEGNGLLSEEPREDGEPLETHQELVDAFLDRA